MAWDRQLAARKYDSSRARHVGTLSAFGTVRHMVFFVIELKTRIVHIGGIRVDPDEAWMIQIVRNLCDPTDGFLRRARFLVHDRDPLFTKQWKLLLASSGISSVAIPAQSPNCNPHAERFIKSIRNECLDRFIIFGEAHLRHLLREYVSHYNAERYHQGMGWQAFGLKMLLPPTTTTSRTPSKRVID